MLALSQEQKKQEYKTDEAPVDIYQSLMYSDSTNLVKKTVWTTRGQDEESRFYLIGDSRISSYSSL